MVQIVKKTPAILLAGLIAVAAAFAIGALTAQEAHAIEGNGESGNPYIITSYPDLKEFADIVNGENGKTQNQKAWAILTKDIDCSSDTTWVPIGRYTNSGQYSQYTGHFDGRGHAIKNLSNTGIDNIENADYQGLFGEIGRGGEVTNVNLEGGKITGNEHIGGIAGSIYEATGTTIAYCRNTGEVSGRIYVGGISGDLDSQSKITNCCNTGKVSGANYVGGIAGNPAGEITNCYNIGAVSATENEVGGVAGYNAAGDITNCYNTGAISGIISAVGGVVGDNKGEITNCYNTGAVSGRGLVGGVAGENDGGDITNCYNTGAVSGSENVGGVAGYNKGGTITICYYDKTFGMVTKTVGNADDTEDVKGLTTSQMTGETALENMEDFAAAAWFVKANGIDSKSGDYYLYYPHLKGFAYSSDPVVANWPAKAIVDADWNEPDSYTYNASDQKPTVTRVTVSQKPVEVPKGMTAVYSNKNDSGWDETSPTAPTVPGTYKMTIRNGDEVIDEIVFIILEPDVDYTVAYQKQEGEDPAVWSTDTVKPIAAGTYKAVVTRTGGTVLGEKVFQIEPASIAATVNGSSTEKTYNGVEQTYTGTVTAASSDTAFDATKFQYTGSAEAKGTNVGDHIVELNAGNCTYADPNYKVTWAIGDPVKLTIEKAPLTITAKDQTLTYNGQTQGEGDTVYADAAQIAEKVTVEGLQGDDELTSIVVDGQGTDVGKYDLVPSNATINEKPASDKYDVTYVNGTLTIAEPTPVTYTVIFVDGQGKTLKTEKVESGKAATAPTTPKRSGYTFTGWDKDFSKVTRDLTVTAKWKKNAAKVSGTLLSKITAKGKSSLVLTWSKVKGADGYDVFFSKCGTNISPKKVKTIKGNKTFKWTKNGLKAKKGYKAVVKAYTIKNGKKTYVRTGPMVHAYTSGGTSKYTNAKSVTVKKASVSLKAGKTYKIKAKVVKLQNGKKLVPTSHAPKLRYVSSNKKIATVSKSGKITAKSKGSCKVYVIAVNGASKAVKVTVR